MPFETLYVSVTLPTMGGTSIRLSGYLASTCDLLIEFDESI